MRFKITAEVETYIARPEVERLCREGLTRDWGTRSVHAVRLEQIDRTGADTTLEVPEGCTGAVVVPSGGGRPIIQHDWETCPVHETSVAEDTVPDADAEELAEHLQGAEPRPEDEEASVSGEEFMAEREPEPEAGDMARSDGLGAEIQPSAREKLMAARFEWLDERDLGGVAADIREGKPLTDILRERADNGPLVHQIATWIDEDASDEAEEVVFTTEARKLRGGWHVKAPGAPAWSQIEAVEFGPEEVVARVSWGTLVYAYRETVQVKG